jgi:demethylmenaquinone methyltransferase/2-methoxy-6-polyprenyl-1,4-benzoquinol methylase
MFNNIAGKYDLLNHLLSMGIDKGWRRKLIKYIQSGNPQKVLDLACGTGDLTISLYKAGVEVIGVDIAEKMLDIAKIKTSKLNKKIVSKTSVPYPEYKLASAENIPLMENSVDAVTIAFGIRNFEDRSKSLSEIMRVLNDSGYLAILEFATPKNILWRGLFSFYFHYILPIIGSIISKDYKAYNYLPASVASFPQYEVFCQELQNSGFKEVQYQSLTGGVAVLYTARKAASKE